MGGGRSWPQAHNGNANETHTTVVIIGAGISGLCAAIDLLERNNCNNFIMFEKTEAPEGHGAIIRTPDAAVMVC